MEVERLREICTSLPLFPLPRTVLLPAFPHAPREAEHRFPSGCCGRWSYSNTKWVLRMKRFIFQNAH